MIRNEIVMKSAWQGNEIQMILAGEAMKYQWYWSGGVMIRNEIVMKLAWQSNEIQMILVGETMKWQ